MAEVDAGAVAPVVPVAPAAPAAPAPDATAALESDAPEGGEKPVVAPKTFTEDQVNEIVQKRLAKESRKAERDTRAEMERRVKAEVEAEILRKQVGERQPSRPQGEPKPEDYQDKTPQEFMRDWLKWEREQTEVKVSTERQTREQQLRQQEEAEYVQSKLSEASEKFPDLDERLGALPALTRPMLEFVIEEDHGPAVGDFIANNPAEAKKIALLSPIKQVLAMRDIAAKLSSPPAPTKAPPPIVPNSGAASTEQKLEEASYEDFVKIRRRQQAAKYGRV